MKILSVGNFTLNILVFIQLDMYKNVGATAFSVKHVFKPKDGCHPKIIMLNNNNNNSRFISHKTLKNTWKKISKNC